MLQSPSSAAHTAHRHSVVAIALATSLAFALFPTASIAQASAFAVQANTPAQTETITFKQPRVTGLARVKLKRFAQKIAPSKKNAYKLEHVDIDVYVNPASNDFMRTAAANMGNEVARRLVSYGIPRDKISHSTKAQERAQTKPGTYDVDVSATPRP